MGKQEYIVLKCHSCSTYQVHIDKKSRSFVCSICHMKQPFSRIFARSSKASDCRTVCSNYNRTPPETLETHCSVKETAASVLVDGQDEERIRQDSSFSGWDAFLCDEEDDVCGSGPGGGASHHSYITDAHRSGLMEEKQSRWRDEKDQGNATVLCTDRQPVKKRQRMQRGLSRYPVDSGGRASCVNTETSKSVEQPVSLKRHPDNGTGGDGQEKSAWFAEFLDE